MTLRIASFMLAALTALCLIFTPVGWRTALLAALFFVFFCVFLWALGPYDNEHVDIGEARPARPVSPHFEHETQTWEPIEWAPGPEPRKDAK